MKFNSHHFLTQSLVSMVIFLVTISAVQSKDLEYPETSEQILKLLNQGGKATYNSIDYEWLDGEIYNVTGKQKTLMRGDMDHIRVMISPKLGIVTQCLSQPTIDTEAQKKVDMLNTGIKQKHINSHFEISIITRQNESDCDTDTIFRYVYNTLLTTGIKKSNIELKNRKFSKRVMRKLRKPLINDKMASIIITRTY